MWEQFSVKKVDICFPDLENFLGYKAALGAWEVDDRFDP